VRGEEETPVAANRKAVRYREGAEKALLDVGRESLFSTWRNPEEVQRICRLAGSTVISAAVARRPARWRNWIVPELNRALQEAGCAARRRFPSCAEQGFTKRVNLKGRHPGVGRPRSIQRSEVLAAYLRDEIVDTLRPFLDQ